MVAAKHVHTFCEALDRITRQEEVLHTELQAEIDERLAASGRAVSP